MICKFKNTDRKSSFSHQTRDKASAAWDLTQKWTWDESKILSSRKYVTKASGLSVAAQHSGNNFHPFSHFMERENIRYTHTTSSVHFHLWVHNLIRLKWLYATWIVFTRMRPISYPENIMNTTVKKKKRRDVIYFNWVTIQLSDTVWIEMATIY